MVLFIVIGFVRKRYFFWSDFAVERGEKGWLF